MDGFQKITEEELENAAELFAAGADVLVAGSAVFGAPDPEEAIRRMKR